MFILRTHHCGDGDKEQTIMIDYHALSDEEKLELLQLMYYDLKHSTLIGNEEKYKAHKERIIAETQLVYSRIKQRSH